MNKKRILMFGQFLRKIAEVEMRDTSVDFSKKNIGKIINLSPEEMIILRSDPSPNSATISKVGLGEEIIYLGEKVDLQEYSYLKVEVDGKEGWISSSFIEYYDQNGNIIYKGKRNSKSSKKAIKPSSNIISPIPGTQMTSKYGMRFHPIHKKMKMHRGVDLTAKEGTPILAPESGTVVNLKPNNGGAGNTLYLAGAEEREWIFMHLSSFGVKKGDIVEQGQEIAKSGKTGGVTGPHLHLELKIGGSHVDPMSVLSISTKEENKEEKKKEERLRIS